jgi:hypothetical protein
MREYNVRARKKRVLVANGLLGWMVNRNMKQGYNVTDDIIEPYQEYSSVELLSVWTAWDLLKSTGRCWSKSCWQWQRLSNKLVKVSDSGVIK